MELNGRPNTIDDYLSTLPSDYMQWYTFDNKEATYANLKLLDKVHDSVNDKMIDNPKSLPSESDCTNGLKAMQDAWDLEHTGYKKSRKKEYKSVVDQLDQLYHDMTAGKLDTTGEWYKSIKAVKDKHAKG